MSVVSKFWTLVEELKLFIRRFVGTKNVRFRYLNLFINLSLIFAVCIFMYNLAETEGDSEENLLKYKKSYSSFQVFGFLFFLLFIS
jgi:hypothetical protein